MNIRGIAGRTGVFDVRVIDAGQLLTAGALGMCLGGDLDHVLCHFGLCGDKVTRAAN